MRERLERASGTTGGRTGVRSVLHAAPHLARVVLLLMVSTVVVGSAVAPGAAASPAPTGCATTGTIAVTNSSTNASLGFVSNVWNSFGEFTVTTDPTHELQVSVPSGSAVSIGTLNGPNDATYPYLGGVQGFANTSTDLKPGSPNYAYQASTVGTASGAVPAVVANSFNSTTGLSEAAESAIWTLASDNTLHAQWVNSDGTTPPTSLIFSQSVLVMTGDVAAFSANFGPPVPVTMTLVPASSTCADLALTKTGTASVAPGGTVTYTLTVTNNGPQAVPDAVVTDTLPAGFTCTSVTGGSCTSSSQAGAGPMALASGASATITVNAAVAASEASGSYTDSATVSSATVGDRIPSNNTASFSTTVTPMADLSITKTDGKTSVTAGTADTYTIVVSNAGPSAVSGATVTDTVPAAFGTPSWTATGTTGTSFTASGSGSIADTVTIPNGASITYTLTGTVAHSATGSLANTAMVTAPTGVTDPTPANNSATDTDTVVQSADLAISKAGPTTVAPGGTITYTLNATNNGPSDAASPTVSDPLPAGTTFAGLTSPAGWTCTTPAVGAGGTVSCSATSSMVFATSATFTLQVHASPSVAGSTLSNTATVSSSTPDPDTSNNTSSAVATTVACDHVLSGSQPSMTLNGGTWCANGATFAGSVAVAPGTTAVFVNSTVNGNLAAKSAAGLSVCGSTVTGTLTSAGATGFVLVGDPGDDACAANHVGVDAAFNSNTGGVEVGHNSIGRNLTFQSNSGTGPFADDSGVEVEANTVSGNLGCVSNTPISNDGQPNTVTGGRYNQCAAATF